MIGIHLNLDSYLKEETPPKAVQSFLGSPQRVSRKETSPDRLKSIIEKIKVHGTSWNIHAPYVINLSNPDVITSSLEMDCKDAHYIANACNLEFISVVIHMGKSLKLELHEAYDNYINNLASVVRRLGKGKYKILLETPASQGTEIGCKLEELASIYFRTREQLTKDKLETQIGICVDTCHVFASGEYNLSTIEDTKRYHTDLINTFKHINLIHLNDSMKECCCKVDRHQKLGEGFIFKENTNELLSLWMQFITLHKIPLVLETPGDNLGDYTGELEMLNNSVTNPPLAKISKKITSPKVELNKNILEMLEQMILLEKTNKQKMKVRAYTIALQNIGALDFEITDISQLKDVDGIGKSITAKIEEMLNTGTIKKLEGSDKNLLKAIKVLTTIANIGEAKATELFQKYEVTSLTALKKIAKENPDILTENQHMSLKYHADLQKRIPREEIKKFEEYMNNLLGIRATICGSYRREKPDSGDIDLLIPVFSLTNFQPEVLIKNMGKSVRHVLSKGDNKIMMLYSLPNKQVVHLDLVFVHEETSFAAALLYFTGSKESNLMLRNKAKSMNMKLNEYGLFLENGTQLECKTEKDIYETLKETYKEPKDR